MSKIRNIGIITAGGDCGGLNAIVRSASYYAESQGIATYIIPNGYSGLYNLIDFDSLSRLTLEKSEDINSTRAGSAAGHSRVKISKIKDSNKYQRISAGLKKFNIDGLVIAGGDDTGSVVVDLYNHGFPVVHTPKTMDLDLQTYSVGGDSTINRIAQLTEDLKTTGKTHNRIIIIEVFGRYSGHTAFRGGIAADADCILIPEIPVDFDIVYKNIKKVFFRRVLANEVFKGTYTMLIAEGIKDKNDNLFSEGSNVDAFGHLKLSGAAKHMKSVIEDKLKNDPEAKEFMQKSHMYVEGIFETPEVRDINPSHIIRSGPSTALDVNFGKEAGIGAVMLLMKGIYGVTFANLTHNGEINYMKTEEAIKQRHVNLNQVAYHENNGICFGREPVPYIAEAKEILTFTDRIF